MKQLLITLTLILSLGFTYAPPVPTTIYSGNLITSAGTTEVELQFGDLPTNNPPQTVVYIQVSSANSGTIQFSIGKTIDGTYTAWSAGAQIPMTITNGLKNLRYKASASGQKFSVTHYPPVNNFLTGFWKTKGVTDLSSTPIISSTGGARGVKFASYVPGRISDIINSYDTLYLGRGLFQGFYYLSHGHASTPSYVNSPDIDVSLNLTLEGGLSFNHTFTDSITGHSNSASLNSGSGFTAIATTGDTPGFEVDNSITFSTNQIKFGGQGNAIAAHYCYQFGSGFNGAFGEGSLSGGIGLSFSKPLNTGGRAAFGWYESTAAQTSGHGAQAANSAIIGGIDENIPNTSTGSTITASNTGKVSSGVTYTLHSDNLRIKNNTYLGAFTVTPNSTLQVGGGVSFPYVAKTANYTIAATDYLIDCTANSFTVTFPTAAGITGRIYVIRNSGVGTITLATTSSQTINGAAPGTQATTVALRYMSTGAAWITF